MNTTKAVLMAGWLVALMVVLACGPDAAPDQGDLPTTAEVSAGSYLYTDFYGAATASVEERVYQADVVVRARFVSSASTTLMFRAIQYLKGTGETKFIVEAATEGRNTQWDNQDAILFLKQHAGKGADFTFVDSTDMRFFGVVPGDPDFTPPPRVPTYEGTLPEGYTVDTRNPVWLPVEASGSTREGASTRSPGQGTTPSGNTIITDYDSRGAHQTVTQKALQSTIDWMGAVSSQGGATPGQTQGRSSTENPSPFTQDHFDNCVLAALRDIRISRDWEQYHNEPYYDDIPSEEQMDSGSARGTQVYGFDLTSDHGGALPGNQRYDRHELSGDDSHLFESTITDADNNSRNGYSFWITNRRPLPAGTYNIRSHGQAYYFSACDYRTDPDYNDIIVSATAPAGTVHEAFFDPATTTAGVGFLAGSATTTGVLEPAGFSMRGRDINITGLEWRNGQVVLSFDRIVQLSDGLSFIETDGTAGLYLSQYDDTEDLRARTATWDVPEQPWEPGDELMLRIGPIPLPGVRNLTAEANSAGEVVLRWEVAYRAGVNGYRIWRHRPGRDEGPRIYVSDTLSTDTTYTDANSPVPNLTEYRVQAIDRIYNAGESSESVRVGSE